MQYNTTKQIKTKTVPSTQNSACLKTQHNKTQQYVKFGSRKILMILFNILACEDSHKDLESIILKVKKYCQ